MADNNGFDPNQPRAEDGKWTVGNGGSGQRKGYDSRKDGVLENIKNADISSIYNINSITEEIEADLGNAARILRQAIADGKINTRVHRGNQDKHIPGTQNYRQEIVNGREPSILTADAEELIKSTPEQEFPSLETDSGCKQKFSLIRMK